MSDQVRINPCRPTISEVKEQQLKCATPRQSVLFFRSIHGISRLYGNLNVRQHEDYWEICAYYGQVQNSCLLPVLAAASLTCEYGVLVSRNNKLIIRVVFWVQSY